MEHIKRTERLSVIAYLLTSTPNRVHNYAEFCEKFSVAKSTVSEDIDLISDAFRKHRIGMVETISGAAGGVRFLPLQDKDSMLERLRALAQTLSQPGRLLPGDYLYDSDMASNAFVTVELGQMIAAKYYDNPPDFVLTMETKGIPLALMTSKAIGCDLVVARRDSKAYEGNSVKINYTSGVDSNRLETMSIPRRAVKEGQSALIVDDFTKGGGTLQGMREMMSECGVKVLGVEVMIMTEKPKEKHCDNFSAMLVMGRIDRVNKSCEVQANEHYFD